MAKPTKRRIDSSDTDSSDTGSGGTDSSDSGAATPSSTRAAAKQPPSERKVSSRRVTPAKGAASSSGRTGRVHRPSPPWVPVLMFGLWGLGLLVIILNYMQILPGGENGGNGWYLVGGLGAILAGIVVATQYR